MCAKVEKTVRSVGRLFLRDHPFPGLFGRQLLFQPLQIIPGFPQLPLLGAYVLL